MASLQYSFSMLSASCGAPKAHDTASLCCVLSAPETEVDVDDLLCGPVCGIVETPSFVVINVLVQRSPIGAFAVVGKPLEEDCVAHHAQGFAPFGEDLLQPPVLPPRRSRDNLHAPLAVRKNGDANRVRILNDEVVDAFNRNIQREELCE